MTTDPELTDGKSADQTLHESEQRLKAILDASPIGISIHTQEGKCLFANEAYARMLRCTLVEAMEINAEKIYVDPNLRNHILDSINRSERLEVLETEQWCRDGTKAKVFLQILPVEYGGQQAFAGWHYDLTKRLEAEQAQRESIESSPFGPPSCVLTAP